MKKWMVKSVITPELINENLKLKEEEENKLLALLEQGFEPFAVFSDRIWLRISLKVVDK